MALAGFRCVANNERGWHFILGFEPDKEEDLIDLERKLTSPIQREIKKIGRNEPCSCGSRKEKMSEELGTLKKGSIRDPMSADLRVPLVVELLF